MVPQEFIPNKMRRYMFFAPILVALSSWGCTQQRRSQAAELAKPISPEDAALKHKFRGISGGEKVLSATESLDRVDLYDENGAYFARGVFGRAGGYSSYGGGEDRLPMPKTLRYVRFGEDAKYLGNSHTGFPAYTGTPLVDVTVPVAERIPDDLLDDLRRDPKGSLRLKIRLMPDAILIGWDIERRPGFNAQKSREGQHYPAAYSHTGGDFKEMRIAYYIDAKSPCQECVAFARNVKKTRNVVYADDPNGYISMPAADDLQNRLPEVLEKNGYFLTPVGERYTSYGSGRQLREKGWYIHPRTKQRIETDF